MVKLKRNSNVEAKTASKGEAKEYRVMVGNDISEAVEKDLSRHEGIVLFGNDNVVSEYLQLPADITEVDSRELGRYFSAFTQQKMYVRTVVGRLSAVVRERNGELNGIRSEVYSSLPAKVSVKEKELLFSTDSRAIDFLNELFAYEEKLRMVVDYLDSLVDAITLISREISRREGDWNNNRREDNINSKR